VKVSNLIGRGVIQRVDDGKQTQELQVDLLEGETRDELERLQQYGLSSHPPKGSDCLVVFVGGRRDQGYCLAAEKQGTRIINLSEGEVALYSQHGQTIVLKANGDIELNPKAGQKVKISTDVEVTGTLTATTDVVGGGKHLATHTHPANLTLAGTTASPGSPLAGTASGSTGGPS
jgi:phage gp45-like